MTHAYGEAKLGQGKWHRFLVDLDLSTLNQAGDPVPTGPVTVVDLDGDGSPDLAASVVVRHIVAAGELGENRLEIRLRPTPEAVGRGGLRQLQARIFVDTTRPVVPADPSLPPITGADSFAWFGYAGGADEIMPSIVAQLGTTNGTTLGIALAPDDDDTPCAAGLVDGPADAGTVVDVTDVMVRTSFAEARRLEGGRLVATPVWATAFAAQHENMPHGAPQLVQIMVVREDMTDRVAAEPTGAIPDIYPVPAEVDNAAAVALRIVDPAGGSVAGHKFRVRVCTPHIAWHSTSTPPGGQPVTVEHPGRPETPSVVGLVDAPVALGGVPPGTHRYRVTYVLANGNETAPSQPSLVIEVPEGGQYGVVLDDIAVGLAPPGKDLGVAVVARRLYRTLTGDDGEYFMVQEVAGNTATSTTDFARDRPGDMASLPGPPLADRVIARVGSSAPLDVAGTVELRSPDPDTGGRHRQRIEARLTALPRCATIDYDNSPPDGHARVRWASSGRLGSMLASLRWPDDPSAPFISARVADVPVQVTGDWLIESKTRLRAEIIADTAPVAPHDLGDRAIGELTVVVASHPWAWRDTPQALSVDVAEHQALPDGPVDRRVRVGFRGLGRVRLALGREAVHSRWDAGLVADLWLIDKRPKTHVAPGLDQPARVLILRDRPDGDNPGQRLYGRLAARAESLPTRLHVDVHTGTDLSSGPGGELGGIGALVEGEIRRLQLLFTDSRTNVWTAMSDDRVWLRAALPTTGERVEVHQSDDRLVLVTAGDIVVEGTLNHREGIRVGPLVARAAAGHVRLPAQLALEPHIGVVPGQGPAPVRMVTADDPAAHGDRGFSLVTKAPRGRAGIDARLAVTAQLGEDSVRRVPVDRLVPVRATPQGRYLTRSDPGAGELLAATLRLQGLTRLDLVEADGLTAFHIALDPRRPNRSVRALGRDHTPRYLADERDSLKARIAQLPDDVVVATSTLASAAGTGPATAFRVVELRLPVRSGEGVLSMEPNLDRDALAGRRAGEVAGIGRARFTFDGLPRGLRLTLPVDPLPTEWEPANWALPAGWRAGGAKVEISDSTIFGDVHVVSWSRDRPLGNELPLFDGVAYEADGLISLWSCVRAPFVQLTVQNPGSAGDPPRLEPIELWLLEERPPADLSAPGGGLGFRIGSDLRVKAGMVLAEKRTLARAARWNALGDIWTWEPGAELQFDDYQGEITFAGPLGLATRGDMTAGPGRWFLRVFDGLPWYAQLLLGWGSIYFGNTGGTWTSRPRIFKFPPGRCDGP